MQVYITGTVEEDYKEVEEVDDGGTSVGNGAYNTAGVVENIYGRSRSLRWTQI